MQRYIPKTLGKENAITSASFRLPTGLSELMRLWPARDEDQKHAYDMVTKGGKGKVVIEL
jgi:hypothetical protein